MTGEVGDYQVEDNERHFIRYQRPHSPLNPSLSHLHGDPPSYVQQQHHWRQPQQPQPLRSVPHATLSQALVPVRRVAPSWTRGVQSIPAPMPPSYRFGVSPHTWPFQPRPVHLQPQLPLPPPASRRTAPTATLGLRADANERFARHPPPIMRPLYPPRPPIRTPSPILHPPRPPAAYGLRRAPFQYRQEQPPMEETSGHNDPHQHQHHDRQQQLALVEASSRARPHTERPTQTAELKEEPQQRRMVCATHISVLSSPPPPPLPAMAEAHPIRPSSPHHSHTVVEGWNFTRQVNDEVELTKRMQEEDIQQQQLQREEQQGGQVENERKVTEVTNAKEPRKQEGGKKGDEERKAETPASALPQRHQGLSPPPPRPSLVTRSPLTGSSLRTPSTRRNAPPLLIAQPKTPQCALQPAETPQISSRPALRRHHRSHDLHPTAAPPSAPLFPQQQEREREATVDVEAEAKETKDSGKEGLTQERISSPTPSSPSPLPPHSRDVAVTDHPANDGGLQESVPAMPLHFTSARAIPSLRAPSPSSPPAMEGGERERSFSPTFSIGSHEDWETKEDLSRAVAPSHPQSSGGHRVFIARSGPKAAYEQALANEGHAVVPSFSTCTLCFAMEGVTVRELGVTREQAGNVPLFSIRFLDDLLSGSHSDAVVEDYRMEWPAL